VASRRPEAVWRRGALSRLAPIACALFAAAFAPAARIFQREIGNPPR